MEFLYTLITIFCLIFGFYCGYKIGKEQTIPKMPKEITHPIEARKEKKEVRKDEEKLKVFQKNLEEIDNFGG